MSPIPCYQNLLFSNPHSPTSPLQAFARHVESVRARRLSVTAPANVCMREPRRSFEECRALADVGGGPGCGVAMFRRS